MNLLKKGSKNKIALITMTVSLILPSFACASNTENFTDLAEDAWYKDAIEYVLENNIFKGTSDNTFSPNDSMTRGMFVTVLGRKSNISEQDNKYNDEFDDVSSDDYYAPYVKWASENGIVKGIGDNKFSPESPITREDTSVMIRRYYESIKEQTLSDANNIKFDKYSDREMISYYAVESMKSALNNDIMVGYENQLFPKDSSRRVEVAQIMKNLESYESKLDSMYKKVLNFDESRVETISIRFVDGKYIELDKGLDIKEVYNLIYNTEIVEVDDYVYETVGGWRFTVKFILDNGKEEIITIIDSETVKKENKELKLKEKLDEGIIKEIYDRSSTEE